ncbi:MAG: sigma-70 family RNA polymerase sigma factor [Archangium sp.]|nr:sigma-70 family RNA polymerase sigma factor [Archangium sp.]
MPSDADLLRRAHGGDAAALEDLLSRHEASIYRFGLRMCGNEADAKDVLQETLLAAFSHVGEFRGEAALSTWLFQVARSFCARARRGVAATSPHVGLDAPEVASLPADTQPADAHAHAREVAHVLTVAMQALEPAHREVLVLRDVEGLSAEEAASVLGIEVGALKSRLHRARLALKAGLSTVLSDAPPGDVCPDLAEDLAAFAASDIDQAACARIEAHLETCPACRSACDTLKRTVALCRALPGGDVPAPIKAAVRRALRM